MEAHGASPHVFMPQATQSMVLCCLCGIQTPPNPTNMCVHCIKSQVDITEGIQKQVTVLWCKECNRYLQPPKHWMRAELESKELLTFCIKKLKGLAKVKLVDAAFIWTEPHSRRLKVRLTVQKEVLNGAILQQTFVVEYVVEPHMCLDCNRANANPNTWSACCQVRQHVPHKRTFFYLEQLIIKHGADELCLKVKDIHEGVDFFFQSRSHAMKLVDFLQSVVPIRYRHDKQLVSHNIHESTYNYKYTFSIEIAPLCKDDLVCLPPKVSRDAGHVGPVMLCTRVTASLQMVDPLTLRTYMADTTAFFRQPYRPLISSKQLIEYVVLDIEPLGPEHGPWALAEAQVARARDFGVNDTIFITRTHLGRVLQAGDKAWGYDLANLVVADEDMQKYIDAKGGSQAVPEVVLVRKSYEEKRKKRRLKGHRRPWMLKRMDIEAADEPAGRRSKARDAEEAAEEERERFLEELEEDPEMRKGVALFRDPTYNPASAHKPRGMEEDDGEEDDGDQVPEVPLEELLDNLEALQIEGDHGAEGEDVDMIESD